MNSIPRRLAGVALTLLVSSAAWAEETYDLDIADQELNGALKQFAEQSGLQVVYFTDIAAGKRTRGVQGTLSADQALAALLDDTDLTWSAVDDRTYSISGSGGTGSTEARGDRDPGNGRAASGQTMMARMSVHGNSTPNANPPDAEGRHRSGTPGSRTEALEEVIVTGTRIRGGTTPSPVISIDQSWVLEAGYSDLGEVIRAIPQNYSGGQNPGVNLGSGSIVNQNITSGSAFNLRGLGPDATLTLLNGRRLSYSGFVNAVDVSIIPVTVLERIEVITDGASAIYGSDAVAGVANIITRRDYDGVEVSALVGTATDGGGTEREYGLTAGTTWDSGGMIGAYEYKQIDAILGQQRSYTEYMLDPNTLLPERDQHNGFLSVHQGFGAFVRASVDAVYTERDSERVSAQPTQNVDSRSATKIYVVSPNVEILLTEEWSLTLGGSSGRDETRYGSRLTTPDGNPAGESRGCYCNDSRSLEVGAEGPAFTVSGGDVRFAIGAGYRENRFEARSYTSTSLTEGELSSRYAYGEVLLPLVSPDQGVGGAHKLEATAALRYEDYGSLGDVTTPKLGLVYQPSADFTLKGSWGKSYKAPNLLQQFQDYIVYLQPAAATGATGHPDDATVLMTWGGNPDLEPERAESWTASALFHPQAISGLQVELSYFDIDYTDRVVQPVNNVPAAFRDPIYAAFLEHDPSPSRQAEIIAPSDSGVTNFTPGPYDPANVVGIIHNRYVNVARQRVRGIDLSGSYAFDFGGGNMVFRGSASWLDGQQQNTPAQPEFDTAGMIFNPPKLRARAGTVWSGHQVMLSGFVNYLGGVTDNRMPVETEVGSFTTVDANFRYSTRSESGAFSGIDLALSVHNLLDREPPFVTPIADFAVNYDSTNYSPVGRFVSFSVSKRW